MTAATQEQGAQRASRTWSFGSMRARVYWTLRRSQGMHASQLIERLAVDRPDVSKNSVYCEVNELRRAGLLLPGPRGSLLVASKVDQVPYRMDKLVKALTDLLKDCEAGISRQALAREAGVCQAEVEAALNPLVLRYEVRMIRIDRPLSLDGGPGYQWTPGQVQAVEFEVDCSAAVPTARLVGESADVRQMRQRKWALVGRHGAYAVTDADCLQVAWGGEQAMRITLPPSVTQELFGFVASVQAEQAAA